MVILDLDRLKDVLERQYALEDVRVVPRQGGWAALAFQAFTENRSFFVKVYEKDRRATARWTMQIRYYIPILLWLGQHSPLRGGIPVPLLTKNGDCQYEDDDYTYLLYHLIEGDTIGHARLTTTQIGQLSRMIAMLHQYGESIPVATDPIKEDFTVPYLSSLRSVLRPGGNGLPPNMDALLRPKAQELETLVHTVEDLSHRLNDAPLHLTLCHTDIHNWNLMQTSEKLVLIDWEGLKLAPVEADMIFFADQWYFQDFLRVYREYHPDYTIDPVILRFYQYRRKLEDIWEFIEQLLFDTMDQQGRDEALHNLAGELEDM